MRIALIGAAGQLGRTLQQQLGDEVVPLTHGDVELTDPANIDAALTQVYPALVINAAAYNLVDRAEEEPDVAFAVNALGPRNLALACQVRAIPLVHVSTDYVFSGRVMIDSLNTPRSMPYREIDRPEPQSAYGLSKLAGELFVRSLCRKHFVVRTCGLYGPTTAPGRGNFVQTMLRLGRERDEVSVVDDQTCCPTSTADLARAIVKLVATEAYGLYHATNSESTTWCQFAREIFQQARLKTTVRSITSAEFGAKAARPCYSALNCDKLQKAIDWQFPSWQAALAEYLNDVEAK